MSAGPGRATVQQLIGRVPPFTDPRVRKQVLRGRRELERVRRRALERRGSDRRSRPALYDMERKLAQHLPARGGFFVEAGANDGYLQSNTYWLARFQGWRGVLVEPIPELYAECVRERPESRVFNCALVPSEREGEPVTMHYGGLMSIVRGVNGSAHQDAAHARAGSQLGWDATYEVRVPGRTLSSLLEEVGAPDVDLLSLDVEGFELDALAGLDLDRFAPRFALVEALDDAARESVTAALAARYDPVKPLSPYDVLYARR
ncbi:MAG TPA: FkbM family methyltransferase [Solirubrobacteraceae bacterium]|nr:FkbM family methyltransferase [Solirubrobacteraceae bacterium]